MKEIIEKLNFINIINYDSAKDNVHDWETVFARDTSDQRL